MNNSKAQVVSGTPAGQQVQQSATLSRSDARKSPVEAGRAALCGCAGAMSQQGMGFHGNESVPQKLLQLVGYRAPKPGADPWVRPPARPLPETAK